MEKKYLLHMLTSAKNLSPFDANMAYDAGWDACIPYIQVESDEVKGLVEDAIFSRGPSGVKRTGLFIGGRDMHQAMEMLETCQKSMVPPFVVSAFADPSGAFTTAAAMVAKVEKALRDGHGEGLSGQRIVALGGTGPVGSAAAVIAANAGARVTILGRQKEKSDRAAELCNQKYGAGSAVDGEANDQLDQLLGETDVVFASAAAGIQLVSKEQMANAPRLKVAADVNAVPPSGIHGLGVMDDGSPIEDSQSGAVGIGALAIGNVKYQTQHRLLQQMREMEEPVYFHFEHAFEVARQCASE
ncbi:MAG: methylenetetrahydromethanopterin dehydrogenase [Gammaproteobacteria bacterium]|nr:methylenetetrahydromethanopterin dehydrogenase [Gammaproteobacteria bacterium]